MGFERNLFSISFTKISRKFDEKASPFLYLRRNEIYLNNEIIHVKQSKSKASERGSKITI